MAEAEQHTLFLVEVSYIASDFASVITLSPLLGCLLTGEDTGALYSFAGLSGSS